MVNEQTFHNNFQKKCKNHLKFKYGRHAPIVFISHANENIIQLESVLHILILNKLSVFVIEFRKKSQSYSFLIIIILITKKRP